MKRIEVSNDAYTSWVSKGYEHFSEFGPTQMSIRKISKEIKLPRTSFYYYFENQSEYLKELEMKHKEDVSDFFQELERREAYSCSEFFRVLEKYSLILKFQNQLFKNREEDSCNELFLKVYDELFEKILCRRIPKNHSTKSAKKVMLLSIEVWFSRLQLEKMTIKEKQGNLQEIMNTMSLVFN